MCAHLLEQWSIATRKLEYANTARSVLWSQSSSPMLDHCSFEEPVFRSSSTRGHGISVDSLSLARLRHVSFHQSCLRCWWIFIFLQLLEEAQQARPLRHAKLCSSDSFSTIATLLLCKELAAEGFEHTKLYNKHWSWPRNFTTAFTLLHLATSVRIRHQLSSILRFLRSCERSRVNIPLLAATNSIAYLPKRATSSLPFVRVFFLNTVRSSLASFVITARRGVSAFLYRCCLLFFRVSVNRDLLTTFYLYTPVHIDYVPASN